MTRFSPFRVVVVSCMVVSAGLGLVAPAGDAGATKKVFHDNISDDTTTGSVVPVAANGPVTLTIGLWNDSGSTQAFGSAMIIPPPGITIDTDPAQKPTVNMDTYSTFTVNISSGALLVTNTGPTGTGVPPGTTSDTALLVKATFIVGAGACPPTWNVQVKQSNNFSGPPGNNFSTPDTISTPTGNPKLVFNTQPNVTQYNEAMSPAPVVGAVDACGQPMALTGSVDIEDTIGVIESGNGYVDADTSGTVTASGLTFSQFGLFDQLTATKAGFDDATSVPFSIAQIKETCTSTSKCPNLNLGGNGNNSTNVVTTSNGASGDPLSGSDIPKGDVPTACGEPTNPTPPQVGDGIIVDTPRAKTVTIIIPKAIVQEVPNNGTPFYDICLDIPTEQQALTPGFTDKFGHTNVYTGLLPNCATKTSPGPCIVSRTRKNGDEYITYNLPVGDPRSLVL